MWAVSALTGGHPLTGARRFFDGSALLLGVGLAVGVGMIAAASGRRAWDAAHVALSPLLLVAGLISYELLAIPLVAGAVLAWTRRRPVLAGVLLGLAVAVAPPTAVLVVVALVVGVRVGRGVDGLKLGATTGLVWLGLRVLLFPGVSGGLSAAWQGYKAAGPGYGSIWLIPQLLQSSRPRWASWWFGTHPLSASITTTLSLLALIAVLAAGMALALTAGTTPRFGPVALVLLAGVLVTGKALPPQVSLLLLPAIALAGLRWRDHLIWVGAELAYFVGVWLYIAAQSDANRGLTAFGYLILLLARIAGICWLGVQGARAIIDPRHDPGRIAASDPGEDDGWPAASPDLEWSLAGASSHPVVTEGPAGSASAEPWLDLGTPEPAPDRAP